MAPLIAGATAARPLGARSGVRPGTSTSTVTATSTTWTVGAHAGVLDLETAGEAGPYGYAIDAAVTGSVTAANATNPRLDIVYVTLSDPAESDGSTTPGVAVGYLAGTPDATPGAPDTPARSMVLAQINVPKSGGGSPSVTWVAPYAVAAGGITPVSALPSTVWGTTAARAWIDVGGVLYVGDGATWRLSPFGESVGTASVSSSAAAMSNTTAVTFPTGRFTSAPAVFAQPLDTAVTTDAFIPVVSDITTTGFNLRLYRANGSVWSTARTVQWRAVQMLSSGAAG